MKSKVIIHKLCYSFVSIVSLNNESYLVSVVSSKVAASTLILDQIHHASEVIIHKSTTPKFPFTHLFSIPFPFLFSIPKYALFLFLFLNFNSVHVLRILCLIKFCTYICHSSSPLVVFFLWAYGNEPSHLLNTC